MATDTTNPIRERANRTNPGGRPLYLVATFVGKLYADLALYTDPTGESRFSMVSDDWKELRIVGSDGPEPVELAEGRWAVIDQGVVVVDNLASAQECVQAMGEA